MNRFKSLTFTTIFLLCLSASGLADGAPASQFGFKGWPYRHHPVCSPAAGVRPSQTPAPASRPTARPGHSPDPGSPSTSGDVGDYTTLSVSAQEYSAWNLINADRESNGLASLPLDETLCALARIKSCDMKNEKYLSHTSPTFGKAADMLKFFGYSFKGVEENIAHHATVEKSQAAFMSSAGHRANILGSQWTRMGVGICYDDQGYVYVTQLFAR